MRREKEWTYKYLMARLAARGKFENALSVPFLNLDVVFQPPTGMLSKEKAADLKMSPLEAYGRSLRNINNFLSVMSLESSLQRLAVAAGMEPHVPREMPFPFYVASAGAFGAAVMLLDDVWAHFHDTMDSELLLVLPSSIYEVLVMPVKEKRREYLEIVKDINGNGDLIDKKSVLVDAVYYHSLTEGWSCEGVACV